MRKVSKTQTNAVMYTVSRKRKVEVQVDCPFGERRDIGTQCSQCSESKGSYGRRDDTKILTYDELKDKYLWHKNYALSWLKEEGLIAGNRICDVCRSKMNWVKCSDRSDGFIWESVVDKLEENGTEWKR